MTNLGRIAEARTKLDKLVNHIRHVIDLHESNLIVGVSPTLSSQIPKSLAAHAFNLFSDSFYRYQIIRTCALWDKNSTDRESIPSVITLVEDDAIIQILVNEIEEFWATRGARRLTPLHDDPEVEQQIAAQMERHRVEHARERAQRAHKSLRDAIGKSHQVMVSPELTSMTNYRNKHLAHSLSQTRLEKTGTVAPPRYGDETVLLEVTKKVMNGLLLGIGNASVSWDMFHENSRTTAQALWHHCTFKIKTGSRRRGPNS